MRNLATIVGLSLLFACSAPDSREKKAVEQESSAPAPAVKPEEITEKTSSKTPDFTNKPAEDPGEDPPLRSTFLVDDLDQFYAQTGVPVQEFLVDLERDTVLTGAAGTRILIKAGIFEGANAAEARILLKECYTYADMLAENLTTLSGNQMLETAGMIHLDATAGGKPLKVKPGAEIAIAFANAQPKDGFELFDGKRLDNGRIDWTHDPLAKEAIPKIVFIRGKYIREASGFFDRHYHLPKQILAGLNKKSWLVHVSFDEAGNIIGSSVPDKGNYTDAQLMACQKFFDIVPELKLEVAAVRKKSWKTDFEFKAMNGQYYADWIAAKAAKEAKEQKRRAINKLLYTNKLGWMNYDKFKKSPLPKRDLVVLVDEGEEVDMKLMVKKYNSVLPGVRTANRVVFSRVPTNLKATLVSIKIEDGQPYVALADAKTNAAIHSGDLRYEAITSPKGLRQQLRKLN